MSNKSINAFHLTAVILGMPANIELTLFSRSLSSILTLSSG